MVINKKKIVEQFPRAKNFSFYLLTTIINTLLMLIINPFLAKNLSHTDYSIIGYHHSFQILLLPLLNFSLMKYYLRQYFIVPINRRDILRDTIIKMILIWGTLAMALSYTFFYFFFKIKNVDIPFHPYFMLTLMTVFFNNFITIQQIEYRLNKKAKSFFYLTLGLRLLVIFSSIILVIVVPLGAFGRTLAIAGATILYGFICFKKIYKKNKIDIKIVKDAVRFSWPLALSALLWYFLNGIDRVFLEELKDVNNMAIYNIAMGFTLKLTIIYTALAQTLEPDIYKSIANKKYRRLVFIGCGLIILNAIPNIIFIIFANPIISLLTAGIYTDASTFARILVFKNISMSLYSTVILIIVGLGFTKSELMNRIFGATASFFMFKFLITKYGYYGAAWGQSISFLIMTIIGLIFILFNKKRMLAHNNK